MANTTVADQFAHMTDAGKGKSPQPSEGTTRLAQDQARYKKPFDLASAFSAARARSGKRFGAMAKEVMRLGFGNSKLTAQEYFYYNLYDDRRFTWDAKTRFLSEHVHPAVIAKCCDRSWWAVADDKLLAYGLLQSAGHAVPETQAVFDRSGRAFAGLRHLRDGDALTAFLQRDAKYPLFAKPLGGIASFGALRILGRDGDMLSVDDGTPLPFAKLLSEIGEQSYIFQTLLRPHPAIAAVSDTVSTIRVMVTIGADGPKLLRTVWKIPGNGNIADNFWRPGNLLGAIDPASGQVVRVVRGTGAELEEVTAHPNSNVTLVGMRLPDWQGVIDMALNGARLFHPLRYQSWDIAITDRGPVAVEVNTGSAFNLAQLAWGEGILTDEFLGFLRGCGYKVKAA